MNTQTAKKRLERANFYTKKGTILASVCKCLDGLKALKTGKIYPYYWTRSKGYYNLVTRYGQMEGFLRSLKIDFVTGNDKNGGIESDFIKLTAKGKRQVKDIDFNLLLTL
jgi:hypothetical protein